MIDLHCGDCLEVMRTLPDGCVDAVVTDPPAGIAFMGKDWDKNRGGRDAWIDWLATRLSEALRLAKPGSHALVWALPRTSHWTGLAIENAGWLIEDRIAHINGQGFPKGKAKLKPAVEDWWLCTKPGGGKWLNIDDCRIAAPDGVPLFTQRGEPAANTYGNGLNGTNRTGDIDTKTGRWPANVAFSHHPDCNGQCVDGCPVAELDRQSGILKSGTIEPHHKRHQVERENGVYGKGKGLFFAEGPAGNFVGDSGGASRFFYCPKASRADRDEGLEALPDRPCGTFQDDAYRWKVNGDGKPINLDTHRKNTHPTVKSTDLMRWLCRLITPPDGTILDPFLGSGSTLKAAVREGFSGIGIESDPESFAIAERRIAAERAKTPLFA